MSKVTDGQREYWWEMAAEIKSRGCCTHRVAIGLDNSSFTVQEQLLLQQKWVHVYGNSILTTLSV